MLLTVNGIKKSFADNTIFENVSFGIDEHDKIGFVGANGAGKSTLIKILIGELQSDTGEIFRNKDLKIGYLEQYSCINSEKTVYDETLEIFSDLEELELELDNIRYEIESNPEKAEALVKKQHLLMEKYENNGGFTYRSRTQSTLMGLGFSEEDLKLNIQNLSGGQKTRVSLAKILLSKANLLFLDEPTNHLDIESVEWLESFLKNYNGAFVVISHDRYFLDKVTNKTFELEGKKFYSMNLGYSAFAAQREIERLSEERNYENTIREIERLEKVVEQQRRWNREKNIKTAESKLKVINRLRETLVKPENEDDEPKFRFKAHAGGGDNALIIESLGMSFDSEILFRNINIQIMRGERVFLLGPNGCGKTTLLKIVMGILKQTAGSASVGANTYMGYYDQLQENLDMEKTILDEVWDEYPKMTQTQIRNALAAFLFTGEEVNKEIKMLSGGERARVELVKLILKDANFLIMDEPTNHLDIRSREALEKALIEYDGTLFVVSHDRYFINNIATRIIRLDGNKAISYIGNYDDYLEKFEPQEKIKEKKENSSKALYNEQKRIEAEKRKTKNRLEKVRAGIVEIEKMIEELNVKLAEISTDYIKAAEITEVIADKNSELESLYEEWESLELKMEEME